MKLKKEQLNVIITFLGLILLIGIFYFATKTISDITGYSINNLSEVDNQDSCLDKKDVTLYFSQTCSYCKKQKEILGEKMELFRIVDCGKNRQACVDAEIKGVPTWIIEGEKYTGVRTLEQLKELIGCEI